MTGFLLDTNVISEVANSRPEPRVVSWVNSQDNSAIFLSAVSIGELRRGFVLMAPGGKRTRLERWFETDVLLWFGERIVPVTREIADRWGALDANCKLPGTPANTADGMIAATALQHRLAVVTRSVKDFSRLGVPLVNPWDAAL